MTRRLVRELRPAHFEAADLDMDNRISSEGFDAFVERMRKACTN